MNLVDVMKDNGIDLDNLFTIAKLNGNEGLMFFKPIQEDDENGEPKNTNLEPICFIIDGAKFVYDEEMDKNIVINSVDRIITLTRIDGIQLNLDMKIIVGFPFKYEKFPDKVIKSLNTLPEDMVEIK